MSIVRLLTVLAWFALDSAGVTAQTENPEAARRAEAVRTLATLQARAAKLPAPLQPSRGRLPDPDPLALALGREAATQARLHEEFPEARRMARIAAQAARAAFDPVAALKILERAYESAGRRPSADPKARQPSPAELAAQDLQAAEERLQIDAEAAHILGDFGLPAEALVRLERASAAAGAGAPVAWRQKKAAWEKAAAAFAAEKTALKEAMASPEKSAQVRSQHAAKRFAATWPLAPESGAILQSLLGMLKDAPEAVRRPYVEALALFHPETAGVAEQELGLLPVFIENGEYEKAMLHAQRLLDHSERLPGTAVGGLTSAVQDLEARLAKIQARGFGPGRQTKQARLADLHDQLRQAEDAPRLEGLAQSFAEDYPTAREVPGLRLALAKLLLQVQPERAREALERVVQHHAPTPEGREALGLLVQAIDDEEGPDKALEWLESAAPRLTDPKGRAEADVRRAELLERLERFDEAKALIEPHAKVDDPQLAVRVARLLEALKSKLSEGGK